MPKLLSWFNERFFFLGIFILLIFIPLYPKFPLLTVPNTYVAIRFEDFFVLLLAFLFILKTLLQKTNLFKDRLNRLILIYFLVGGLSALSAIFITKNVFPNLVLLHWARRIEYMSLFFIAAHSVRNRRDVKDCLLAIFLTTVGVSLYGIGQKFLGFPVISTMNEEFSKGLILNLTEWARVNSTFAGHYDLATYLVLVLSITIVGIVGFKNIFFKIITFIFGVLAFYTLTLTASQVSYAAYLISMILVLVISKKYLWIAPLLTLSVIGLFASRDLNQRYMATMKIQRQMLNEKYIQYQKEWENRFREKQMPTPTPTPTPTPIPPPIAVTTDTKAPVEVKKIIPTPTSTPSEAPKEKRYIVYNEENSEETVDIAEVTADRSIKIRLNVEWPRSLRAFFKNPLLGTGYSSITLATDNDYLRSLGETGILGFTALLLIFTEICRRFIVFLRKNQPLWEKTVVIGIFGAVIGLLINASFIDVLESSKVAFIFWIFIGIMIGIENYTRKEKALTNEKN